MTQTATKLDLAFTAPLRRDTAPGAWTGDGDQVAVRLTERYS